MNDLSRSDASGRPPDRAGTPPNPPIRIDTETAQPARMGDYLAGGGANFPVDREVIDYITAVLPGGQEDARAMIHGLRAFVDKGVRHLAGEAGIRQFLDFGTRMPTGAKLHEVVRELAPDARVVYVIGDDTVMAHAHRLRDDTPPAASDFIRSRPSDVAHVLRAAAATLDFGQPVGLLVHGHLNFITDTGVAQRLLDQLLDAVAPDSYVLLTHLASDIRTDDIARAVERAGQIADSAKMPALTLRSHAEVSAFLEKLQLVGPGIVPADHWDPDETTTARPDESTTFMYGAIARKP